MTKRSGGPIYSWTRSAQHVIGARRPFGNRWPTRGCAATDIARPTRIEVVKSGNTIASLRRRRSRRECRSPGTRTANDKCSVRSIVCSESSARRIVGSNISDVPTIPIRNANVEPNTAARIRRAWNLRIWQRLLRINQILIFANRVLDQLRNRGTQQRRRLVNPQCHVNLYRALRRDTGQFCATLEVVTCDIESGSPNFRIALEMHSSRRNSPRRLPKHFAQLDLR